MFLILRPIKLTVDIDDGHKLVRRIANHAGASEEHGHGNRQTVETFPVAKQHSSQIGKHQLLVSDAARIFAANANQTVVGRDYQTSEAFCAFAAVRRTAVIQIRQIANAAVHCPAVFFPPILTVNEFCFAE